MDTYQSLKEKIEYCGVDKQYGDTGRGWDIQQNPAELAAFLVRLYDLGFHPGGGHKILEIGTGSGGLYRFLRNMLKWDPYVIDVKEPESWHLKDHYCRAKFDSEIASKWCARQGNHFDLVFVDADRSYEALKKCQEIYLPLTQVFAFHGTSGLRDCRGVKQFYDETNLNKDRNFTCGKAEAQGPQRAGIGWIIVA